MSEADINTIIAEFLNQNIEKFYNTSKGVIKGAADGIRLRLNKSYKDYLSCVTERYAKAKSFFARNEPTHLYDFYVPVGVSCGRTKFLGPSIPEITSLNQSVIITGGAGSGKSILMRHLFLDTIEIKQKVPVFLELRELNQQQQTLFEFFRDTLHSNHFSLDDEYIQKAFKAGHFALFFDGFDEVALSLRKEIGKQIQHWTKSYDQNVFVVSSRPDNEFSGWTSFSVLEINSLTLTQASELVEKLPFDSELKSKFLSDLSKGLFERHKSFLSNPLLLSIMLLTYGQSADIPNKLNIFYNQAYEALFQRHDALKGAFQRDHSCSLDIQEFAKVFSAFSIQTYEKRIFQFSRTEALEYLEKSKRIISLEFNSNDYLVDALQAVCLLIEDGLLIVFSHRSFQEYFVARFICDSRPEVQEKLVAKYSRNLDLDNVMKLLYEMRPELVERSLIIPGIEKLERLMGVKKKIGITHYMRFLKFEYSSIEVGKNHIFGHHSKTRSFNKLMRFTLKNCGNLIGWTGFDNAEADVNYLCKKYGSIDQSMEVNVSKLTYRDNIIRDLAMSNIFASIRTLQAVLEIKKALVEKHQDAEESLDEILSHR